LGDHYLEDLSKVFSVSISVDGPRQSGNVDLSVLDMLNLIMSLLMVI
jgi:hypothetical protein